MNSKEKPQKLVALFGTSANPPTGQGGHLTIVEWLSQNYQFKISEQQKEFFSEIWVLPVYRHAYREKEQLIDFDHRMNMAKLNFEHFKNVQVRDDEKEVYLSSDNPTKLGTIDTVCFLKQKYPDVFFVLTLGEDTYLDLKNGKWKDHQRLLKLVPIIVIKRKGMNNSVVGACHLCSIPHMKETSSSLVRNGTKDQKIYSSLNKKVLDYMKQHGLYGFVGK